MTNDCKFLATKKNALNRMNLFIRKQPYRNFHTNAKYVSVQGNKRNTGSMEN
jgi:hypothetical protein